MAIHKDVNQLNATITLNAENKKELRSRNPYDDRKVQPGEVLVPMIATNERIKLLHANIANIHTWKSAGRVYQVMFYPVPKTAKKLAMQQFTSELNEYFGLHYASRCLIQQEDGSANVCLKKNDDDRYTCAECPHNTAYTCGDTPVDSLEALLEAGYKLPSSPSAEEEFMRKEQFCELTHFS